jgi:hypothetical protein
MNGKLPHSSNRPSSPRGSRGVCHIDLVHSRRPPAEIPEPSNWPFLTEPARRKPQRSCVPIKTRTARRNSRNFASLADLHRYVLRTTHAIRDTYCVRRSVALGERHVVYDGDLKRVGRRQDGPCAVKALALDPAPDGQDTLPARPAQCMPLCFIRCATRVLHAASTNTDLLTPVKPAPRPKFREFRVVADLRRYVSLRL